MATIRRDETPLRPTICIEVGPRADTLLPTRTGSSSVSHISPSRRTTLPPSIAPLLSETPRVQDALGLIDGYSSSESCRPRQPRLIPNLVGVHLNVITASQIRHTTEISKCACNVARPNQMEMCHDDLEVRHMRRHVCMTSKRLVNGDLVRYAAGLLYPLPHPRPCSKYSAHVLAGQHRHTLP